MQYLTAKEAHRFAEAWLSAWNGNNPEHLASFYSEDAFYLDPAMPEGVKAKRLFDPGYIWHIAHRSCFRAE